MVFLRLIFLHGRNYKRVHKVQLVKVVQKGSKGAFEAIEANVADITPLKSENKLLSKWLLMYLKKNLLNKVMIGGIE